MRIQITTDVAIARRCGFLAVHDTEFSPNRDAQNTCKKYSILVRLGWKLTIDKVNYVEFEFDVRIFKIGLKQKFGSENLFGGILLHNTLIFNVSTTISSENVRSSPHFKQIA